MQTWNLAAGDPLSLTLAADARLNTVDYTNDQIWELSLGGSEPAALALRTTYGLRAHWMRLFPRFVRGETARVDPAGFHTPPRLTRFSPNYLEVTYAPFDGLDVVAEYWAVESQIVTGRIRLTNHSILPQSFRLEWAALLNPIDRQGGMTNQSSGPTHVLAGETSYLCPVVLLTGGPQPISSPYPALGLELELYPGNSRQFTWAAAAMTTYEASLEAARLATARPWEAELARIELLNYGQSVQITTGNADWDTTFALTQKAAGELLHKNPLYLPHPSFVLSRRPDQGFSVRGDGSDHPYLWNGQTALDCYYLVSLLLPGAPELAAGLLRNFLAVQEENGKIDWKPGLGGQRSRRLAQPLLAAMAVEIGAYLAQPDWYREVFPPLLRFFNAWFSPEYDQDGDGFPEWEHPLQSGIEDSPIFDRWSPHAQGIDITRLESPALAAMLYRECGALIEMARVLEEAERAERAYARLSSAVEAAAPEGGLPAATATPSEPRPQTSGAAEALDGLVERQGLLRELLDSTYDPQAKIHRYRDYSTHLSLPGQTLMEFTGSGKATSRKRLGQPNRLVIHLKVQEERSYAVTVTVSGFTPEGEVKEVIEPRGFSWLGMQARATTQHTFLAVKRVEVIGLGDEDQVRVLTTNYTQEDCSLLLPLWAGAPDAGQAQQIIEDTLLARYLQPGGIPACPPDQKPQEELPGLHTALSSALLPWNQMIGEGLLRYGYRDQAAELVTRLINNVSESLKNDHAFRQYYHAATCAASGDLGHLHGLAPLGLFLRVLGIRKIGKNEVIVEGFSPFSDPINVQYHKISITCHPDKTEVVFPGGQAITVDRPGAHRIVLS